MKPFVDITRKWDRFGVGSLTPNHYAVALRAPDLKLLQQICLRYPRLTQAEILRDLLGAALRDVEQSMPYQQGQRVIALDEMGDEIYEDGGLTPRFLELTKQHQLAMQSRAEPVSPSTTTQ